MGLFVDVTTSQEIEGNPVVVKQTKRGGIIVCPKCKGEKQTQWYDYAGRTEDCPLCNGGGAIEIKVK